MALDFQCPQFVDFGAELDSSGVDDMFFDCQDHRTPQDDSYLSPEDVFPEKQLTKEDESRLLNKMEASLAILENTPRLKPGSVVKGKLLVEKFTKTACRDAKPAFKPKTAPLPSVKLLRSKSVACFNKILPVNSAQVKGFRKRSSSLNDLTVKPKQLTRKQIYPVTPMCLKRTIIKAKNKIKTTEERELEEISKLQQQLKQHLRYNELTLKRLKLKPKQSTFAKNTDAKTENIGGSKGLSSQLGRLNIGEKSTRRNIQKVKPADLKKEVMKVDAIMMKNQPSRSKITDEEQNKNDVRKSKYPSTSVVSDVKEENKTTKGTKTVPSKKLGFHSGLVFHDLLNKSTHNKSINFDVKARERTNNMKPDFKMEAPLLNSVLKSRMDGKENIPQNKIGKTTMQNSNCDFVKQVQINKKNFDKFVKNPIKGLPLSENLSRNKC